MIQKTIRLEINLPIRAEITPHTDVDLDFSTEAAIQAVKNAINKNADYLRLFMLAESEKDGRERREDRIIEECLMGRR